MEQDEIWHFYDGSSLTIHIIDQNGNYSHAKLGRDIDNSEYFHIVVNKHSYFAAAVNNVDSYSLVGCTVAPGFEYTDWKMPTREKLIDDFPAHKEIIEKFTHESKIFHITTQEAWDVAKSKGELRETSLDQEGFIHCSYPNQIVRIANDLYKGQKNLLIIVIKRSQTNCRVVDEVLYNLNELFPHVYGPIPVNSVLDVFPFPCDDKGYFSLPPGITA